MAFVEAIYFWKGIPRGIRKWSEKNISSVSFIDLTSEILFSVKLIKDDVSVLLSRKVRLHASDLALNLIKINQISWKPALDSYIFVGNFQVISSTIFKLQSCINSRKRQNYLIYPNLGQKLKKYMKKRLIFFKLPKKASRNENWQNIISKMGKNHQEPPLTI